MKREIGLLVVLLLSACLGNSDDGESPPTEGQAPSADEDSVETNENVAVEIAVLTNDDDPDGNLSTVTIELVEAPSSGIAAVIGNQTILYTPDTDFVGLDIFSYRLMDEDGLFSNPANVSIRVNSVGGDPTLEDLSGVWVGLFTDLSGQDVTGFARFRTDGSADELLIHEDYYKSNSNATGLAEIDEDFEITVAWEMPTLFFRYELMGTLGTAFSTFSGTWKSWDTHEDDVNPAATGTFTITKSPTIATRELGDLAGNWSGTMSFPDHGSAELHLQFDEEGNFVPGGSFDGLKGSGMMAFVGGQGQITEHNRGLYAFQLQDQAQAHGGDDVVQIQGVLPESTNVWSGIVQHYFWGTGTFQLERP